MLRRSKKSLTTKCFPTDVVILVLFLFKKYRVTVFSANDDVSDFL